MNYPPLPERSYALNPYENYYTADQMRAYVDAAQPERKPLSANEIVNMMPSSIPVVFDGVLMEFARAIEAHHGIGDKP